MKSTAFALLALAAAAGLAHADDGIASPAPGPTEDELVRARISGGPDAPAPGLGASVQGGWGGAHAQAIGVISAEALVLGRVTVRAGVQYENATSRPSASVSYLFTDPNVSAIGVLAGVAYKPEGLTEAEGEVEGTLALSRRVGRSLAAASITYGQDADFNHHDAELALSMVDPIAKHAALGGVTRARSGLGSATDLGARWDGLAGAVARVQVEQYMLTAVAGGEVVGVDGGGTRLGVLGTIALGAWF